MNTLLINDTENAKEFASILGLKNHHVRAIFPSIEYAMMVLKRDPGKFRFIVIENYSRTLYSKIHIINALAIEFEDICVINVGGEKYERPDMPNIHSFKNLEEVSAFILANELKSKPILKLYNTTAKGFDDLFD